ncbi:transmembrane protein [Globomyces pollinis-pini]|nr:transmembrane protein [Globomyces pollinis-pini]
MTFVIHSRNIAFKTYSVQPCSISALLYLLFLLAVLLSPLAIAYSSNAFWLKLNSFREQPSVVLSNSFITSLQGYSTIDQSAIDLFYCSNTDITLHQNQLVRVPTIKTWDIDNNADGIVDEFWINMSIPVLPTESIHNFQIAIGLSITLNSRVRMKSEGMIYLQHTSPLNGAGITTTGTLNIKQLELMTESLDYSITAPVFPFLSFYRPSINQLTWTNILSSYLDRNFQTHFDHIPTWHFPRPQNNHFQITIHVRNPTQTIEYQPGVLQVLKNAWIQYVSIFIITYYLLQTVYDYLIRNHMVSSIVNVVGYDRVDSGKPKRKGLSY